jgi:Leucine-rich repeat (LRR) protein
LFSQLEALDLSDCLNLKTLICHSNQLETLNVSNCSNLEYLECDLNELKILDLSHNDKLTYLCSCLVISEFNDDFIDNNIEYCKENNYQQPLLK